MANLWITAVKESYKKVKAEGKLKGKAALEEAIKRAKVAYALLKKK